MSPDPEGTASLSGAAAAQGQAFGLPPGSLLGHYRIQQPLGAGGMGRVYEAADEQLHRTVAIKVLPEGDADEDTRRRFLREAQAASALNHPNIVTVYGVGREGGKDFIVMERIAGRTLRNLIGKGLEVRTAVEYATQIAAALAAAHEAGIVHRDLKPGNIMVTDRGLVKVLDFGIAKRSAPGQGESSLTEPGHIVGTIAYMSPEQVRGTNVDARSDIFSFGSVLYEMVAGRRAFESDTGVETMAAILKQPPAPLKEVAPGALQRVILKCLQKKPHERWQNMSDVKLVLEDLVAELDSPATPLKKPRRFGWAAIPAAVFAGALLTAGAFRLLRPPAPSLTAEPELSYRMLTSDQGLNDYPAISKDGKFVAFASDRGGRDNLDIWLQQIGGPEPIRLTSDSADETEPAFSPDGTRIAFRSEKNGGGIYVVPTLGGDAVLLAPSGRDPRFSPDGRSIAYWTGRGEGSITSSQVFVIDANGGQPRQVHPELPVAQYPVWAPGGDKLLVFGWKDASDKLDWWTLPTDSRPAQKTGVFPRLKSGGLLSSQIPALWRQPVPLEWIGGRVLFTARSGEAGNLWEIGLSENGAISGGPRRVTRGPGRQTFAARAPTGDSERLAFADEELNYDVWSMPVDPERGRPRGEMARATDNLAVEWAPSITADGRQVLYIARHSGTWALVIRELENGRERTLLSSPSIIQNARIAGDGRTVAFSNVNFDLLTIPAAGGTVEKLSQHCGVVMDVSSDGKYITYEPIDNEDLMMFDAAQRKSVVLAPRPSPDLILSGSRISQDGKWVAFHSIHRQTKATQVWIAPLDRTRPVPANEWIPVTDGKAFAQDPCWGAHDRFLYFVSELDGYRCYWAQPLDAATKKPSGEPFPLRHFHSARRSLRGMASSGYLTAVSAGAGQVVFSFPELTGNIWIEERKRAK